MKNAVLPVMAMMMALTGISYSACHESKANSKDGGSVEMIRSGISRLEQLHADLTRTYLENVNQYSEGMGVTSNSHGLDKINAQRDTLETYRMRIEYHKLQLIQADTMNQTRNQIQLKELETDYSALSGNGKLIRSGIAEDVQTKVTK